MGRVEVDLLSLELSIVKSLTQLLASRNGKFVTLASKSGKRGLNLLLHVTFVSIVIIELRVHVVRISSLVDTCLARAILRLASHCVHSVLRGLFRNGLVILRCIAESLRAVFWKLEL